ncbi:peptidylprolyl isomerase [Saccharothrix violaceirubra]|uniref:Peptidyl-prolyl cis-trans isomerase B (Cyclophilin B) n=1 Tax=Saccharothrix violaceirubra TaxID=413306 RepID=A0A7W7WXJ9_9PSEU|nr:peptidylprolyl isomerase [Saccharothrix violaceirubra]MBB4967171.1 peptidyl-prolyl cis-trans isomerase B (cyclophilin B) [Saccharothrix violaceirubra]
MRRRLIATVSTALLLGACSYSVTGAPQGSPSSGGPSIEGPTVDCEYVRDRTGNTVKAVDPPSAKAAAQGEYVFTAQTNRGVMEFRLDAKSAPCAVHSFRYLVESRYYIGSTCHKLSTEGLFYLQCGDAGTTGKGDPGYRYSDPGATTSGYRRGVIAMASPDRTDSHGSQFFVIYQDAAGWAPDFPIIGKVSIGLEKVDDVAKGGIVAGTAEDAGVGRPSLALTITGLAERE